MLSTWIDTLLNSPVTRNIGDMIQLRYVENFDSGISLKTFFFFINRDVVGITKM